MLPELRNSKQYQTSTYRNVQKMVSLGVSTRIPHSSLAKDITNSVLLSFIKEDAEVANLQSWVSTKIDQATDSHISELWQYCYSYALMLLKNEDSAQEVSQTVMISLIQSQQPVMFVKAWLKAAVNNQAMLFLKMHKRDSTLYSALTNEIKTEREPVPNSESDLESHLGDKAIRSYLSKEEYQIFAALKRYPSVKAYASAMGIGYSKARESKHHIYTNLKARYLKKQGWANTPDILDYRQMVNIKRFLDTLLERALSGDFSRVFHYADKTMLPSLIRSFTGFKEVTDWGIHMNPDGSFEVYIVDISNEENPTTISMTITMNKANYIKIIRCENLALMAIISEDISGPLPLEKGRCTLSLDQIKAYL
jgi:DNA-directed RNA polymerase specialized sigma24 family protein